MQRVSRHAVISWPLSSRSLSFSSLKVRYIAVLPFDSTRKLMSVLVQNQNPNLGSILLVKGADSAIFDRLVEYSPLKEITQTHVNEYARSGLRNAYAIYKTCQLKIINQNFDSKNC